MEIAALGHCPREKTGNKGDGGGPGGDGFLLVRESAVVRAASACWSGRGCYPKLYVFAIAFVEKFSFVSSDRT